MMRFFLVLKWSWLVLAVSSALSLVYSSINEEKFTSTYLLVFSVFSSGMAFANHRRIQKLKKETHENKGK